MQYGLQKDWHFEKVISLKGAKLVNEVLQTLHGVGKECLNDSFKNVHLKTKGQRLKKLSLSHSKLSTKSTMCSDEVSWPNFKTANNTKKAGHTRA